MKFSIYKPYEYPSGSIVEIRKTELMNLPVAGEAKEDLEDSIRSAVDEAEGHFGIALDQYGDDTTIEFEIADSDILMTDPFAVNQQHVDDVFNFIRAKVGF